MSIPIKYSGPIAPVIPTKNQIVESNELLISFLSNNYRSRQARKIIDRLEGLRELLEIGKFKN